MEFRVLGPLEVLDQGRPIALAGAKQRALLAVLLLHANQVLSSDRLIDELWGGEPPKTAAKSLQTLISQLRKLLEPERKGGAANRALVTRPPGYSLQIDPEQLDLERFRRLATEGREALGRDEPHEAAEKLRRGLALWRGDPLADFAYEPFAQAEIDRLDELRLAALEDRIDADLALGRHAEVVAELERLAERLPLRERIRGQLMLALYRSGRQAEALAAYRDTRQALTEELGIEPSRALRDLERLILEQDADLDLAASVAEARREPPPEAGAADTTPSASESFVGREDELAAFGTALDGALAGRMSILLIAGEPGIGKSRLADEATTLAEARGAGVCWGRCWEAGGAPAYWPWVQALRAYIRGGDAEEVRRQLAPGATDIAQMLPELHELFPDLPPPPSLDPEGARFRLFDSTASFLRAAAERQPLVLVLDDMHAADEPSLLLLRFLARSLRDARMVLVAAYRDTETRPEDALNQTVAEVRREPVSHAIRLGGLDVAGVAGIIGAIGRTEAREEVAVAIHRETEGNPLFVSELVRLLAAEGRLDEIAQSGGRSSLPQGVRDVIGYRLRLLSDECTRLLATASVLGRDFRIEALERLVDNGREGLLDLIDESQRAQVVVERPAGLEGWRFSHALIRDSLYDDLGTGERLRLHRRAAEGLEELYGPENEAHLAELAHHYFAAAAGGSAEKAVIAARRAGDRASQLVAYEEAARHYRMALDALELQRPRDDRLRCELLLSLGEAVARGGEQPAAQRVFTRAAEAARELDAPLLLARAALGYGGRWVWFRAGKDERLIDLLEEALDGLPEGEDESRAMLLARLAGALRDRPVSERRVELATEALAIARRLDEPRTLAYVLGGMYSAYSWPRDVDAWLAMARELIALARNIGDKEQGFIAHGHALGALMVRCEIDAAEREFEAMTEIAAELRQPVQSWWVLLSDAMRQMFAGRLDRADEVAQEAAELSSGAQGLDATYYYTLNLQRWALRREQGRLAEVEPSLERYLDEYPAVFSMRALLASVRAELGDEVLAREALYRIAEEDFANLESGMDWFLGASVLASVCARLDDAQVAEPLYRALLPYADYNLFAMPEVALGSASRPLGVLASTMSRWEEAQRHFERALDANDRMRTPPWLAHTRLEYAAMLIRRGAPADGDRASELLQAAHDTFEELGMTSWQAEAAALRAPT